MKLLIFILGMTLSWSAAADQSNLSPFKQGLPLPWPFPWAKECPIDWKSMEGRYLLSDSMQEEELDIKITVISQMDLKLVRVSRYSRAGKLIADGFTMVNSKRRTLRLYMMPLDRQSTPLWAVIRLYYQSSVFSCSQDQLVPILTLDPPVGTDQTPTQYRLVRRSPREPWPQPH